MGKTIFVGLIIIAFATVMATSSVVPILYADKGGDPSNSERAQQNADERHGKVVGERQIQAEPGDNPHNDIGQTKAHENYHDGIGV